MDVNINYELATPANYDEIVEHANFVFSYADCPHEFKTLIPKAYGAERTMWPEHFIARENGRIRGLVGLLPFDMRVMDEVLHVGFIGTVSVHPYSRGMGYMKKCMAMSTAYAREHGLDIMALGGQRQRYEYYGYESGGTSFSFSITATNCRHALGGVDASAIGFAPFAEVRERMAELHALYEEGIVAGARPLANFEQICSTWRNRPHAILRGGDIIGYAIASSDLHRIVELRLKDSADFGAVIKAYLAFAGLGGVDVVIPPHRAADVRAATRLCEDIDTGTNEMFMILNYERVVSVYLRLKQRVAGKLPDGRVTLGITGIDGDAAPRSLTVSVQDGEVACAFTAETPDIVLDTIAAQNLLLNPVTYVDTSALPECARSYFPLPAYIESADGF